MLVLVVFVGLAVSTAVLFALMPMLVDLMHREQAQSAADAAALAGVTGGRPAAAAIASANDAELVEWSSVGRDVTVRVSVGGQVVVARATDEP
ncbi:MAG: hypothetical protein ABIP17_16750 [Ilumatobacteraceae bacterium]